LGVSVANADLNDLCPTARMANGATDMRRGFCRVVMPIVH